MGQRRYRVLLISSHPAQYSAHQYRRQAAHPRLEILVAYCSLQGAEPALDPEFGVQVGWDVPLLEGYPWVQVPNWSPRPGLGRFFGLINPGLWKMVREGRYDAVVVFTGYRCASFWIAATAAKGHRTALLFNADAHELRSHLNRPWKRRLKAWLWPVLFRLADAVLVSSSGGVKLMRSLGIPSERVVMTGNVVDNQWWTREAELVSRAAVRRAWGVPEGATVALFCGKLQPWKRPLDLLHAFVKANVAGSYLVYAGDGPLRAELEAAARSLGVSGRVRFFGFTNQSKMPAVYRTSDLMVLPSEYEAFGLVVNEAMLCGCPVVVSDRVGAGYDLVAHGQNGFVFPCGDVNALAGILKEILPDRERRERMGEAARKRMESWSGRENIEALVHAIEIAAGPGVVSGAEAARQASPY